VPPEAAEEVGATEAEEPKDTASGEPSASAETPADEAVPTDEAEADETGRGTTPRDAVPTAE
jgi:hypothetical protein